MLSIIESCAVVAAAVLLDRAVSGGFPLPLPRVRRRRPHDLFVQPLQPLEFRDPLLDRMAADRRHPRGSVKPTSRLAELDTK